MPGGFVGRVLGALTLFGAFACSFSPGAQAVPVAGYPEPELLGMSRDGETVVFETSARMTAADGYYDLDIYISGPSGVRLVSTGTSEPAGDPREAAMFIAMKPDGSAVYFWTVRSLVDSDRNESGDVYEWSEDGVTRLTQEEHGDPPEPDSGIYTTPRAVSFNYWDYEDPWVSATEDDPIVISTKVGLDPADDDGDFDVYSIVPGSATLVSKDWRGENVEGGVRVSSSRAGGTRLLVRTPAGLVPEDDDDSEDLYVIGPDISPRLVTPGSETEPTPHGFSADGNVVIFRMQEESLLPEDTNAWGDIYRWEGGKVTLVSSGTEVGHVSFGGLTPDGGTVFFTTWVSMVPEDPDFQDVYARHADGSLELITGGDYEARGGYSYIEERGFSADGRSFAFDAIRSQADEDADHGDMSSYVSRDGVVTQVTPASGEGRLVTMGVSRQVDRFVLDPLVATFADPDAPAGFYEWADGEVTLKAEFLSSVDPYDHWFHAKYSADGSRALVTGTMQMVPDDDDGRQDIYAVGPDGAELVSRDEAGPYTEIIGSLRRGPERIKPRFSAREKRISFECRIDSGKWRACKSDRRITNIDPGSHVFHVRGTDNSGNRERRGARKRFVLR